MDILGNSELKWTGMGEFNSDDSYTYYCGQESHRRNGVTLRINERVWNAIVRCNLKNDRMILVCFQGKHHSNPSLCPNHWCQISWSWPVPWRPRRPSTTNTKKRCPFHHRGLECKSTKSRDNWSKRQVWLWSTKWNKVKTNRVFPREWAGHSKRWFQASTLTRDDTTHGHHQMINNEIILLIFFTAGNGEALHSQQKQDLNLTVTQIISSLLQNSGLNWRK